MERNRKNKIDEKVLALAKKIWDYHHLNHIPEKSECILVLGSHDIRVAERGIRLFQEGMAPYLLFSGRRGMLTRYWEKTEAEQFARIAKKAGVPGDRILIENRSVNTGENVRFSYRLLAERGMIPRKLILVQKPYMERRAYATFLKQWPEKEVTVFVTSPELSFEEYPTAEISLEQVIHIMVGDLQRIREYPQRGFQIEQNIPDKVWNAWLELVHRGFTKYLIL